MQKHVLSMALALVAGLMQLVPANAGGVAATFSREVTEATASANGVVSFNVYPGKPEETRPEWWYATVIPDILKLPAGSWCRMKVNPPISTVGIVSRVAYSFDYPDVRLLKKHYDNRRNDTGWLMTALREQGRDSSYSAGVSKEGDKYVFDFPADALSLNYTGLYVAVETKDGRNTRYFIFGILPVGPSTGDTKGSRMFSLVRGERGAYDFSVAGELAHWMFVNGAGGEATPGSNLLAEAKRRHEVIRCEWCGKEHMRWMGDCKEPHVTCGLVHNHDDKSCPGPLCKECNQRHLTTSPHLWPECPECHVGHKPGTPHWMKCAECGGLYLQGTKHVHPNKPVSNPAPGTCGFCGSDHEAIAAADRGKPIERLTIRLEGWPDETRPYALKDCLGGHWATCADRELAYDYNNDKVRIGDQFWATITLRDGRVAQIRVCVRMTNQVATIRWRDLQWK